MREGRSSRVEGLEGVFMPWVWRRHRFAWSFETERTRPSTDAICEIPRSGETGRVR